MRILYYRVRLKDLFVLACLVLLLPRRLSGSREKTYKYNRL